jgi:dTDP-4-dehydrorhamnose 3,5-epimerase
MPETCTWLLDDATRDTQTTDADWNPVTRRLIDGVVMRDVRNVLKSNGLLTEIFRRDWFDDEVRVDQVFQVIVESHGVSAWHAHEQAVDRLFVTEGRMRIVLYDAREDSPTFGLVNDLIVGLHRPALVIVPPKVWHGVQNLLDRPSALLNLPDRAYRYDAPDHWRVPSDTDRIPYRFERPGLRGHAKSEASEI